MMQVTRPVRLSYLVLPFLLLLCCGLLAAQNEESSGQQAPNEEAEAKKRQALETAKAALRKAEGQLAENAQALTQVQEETLGQQAEQAGRLREAFTHYVAALQSASEGSDADQRLREKIIALALKLKPAPTIADDATNYIGRGKAAVEIAKDAEGFKKAAFEFQKALKVAPWLASGYFNLGVVQDKAGQYAESMRSFKLYLLAAPLASDAQDVRGRIAGLEYKIEQQRAEERAEKEKQEALEREERELRARLAPLLGTWNLRTTSYFATGSVGSVGDGTFEFKMTDHSIEGYAVVTRLELFGTAHGTYTTAHDPKLTLRGKANGNDPSEIQWSYFLKRPPVGCEGGRFDSWIPVSIAMNSPGRRISFTLPVPFDSEEGCRELPLLRYELSR